ncbi:IS66 family transposase, partial [Paenibacillus alkaliterrae]
MANWLITGSERWLTPLYDYMHAELLKRDIAHADETTLQVLKEPGRAAQTKSYLWLYRTGRIG